MEKALNRERTHVGRAAYTQRVKDILLECREALVAEVIAKDLKNFEKGKLHDELKWLDVAVHACKLLNATGKYIFITPTELRQLNSDWLPVLSNMQKRTGIQSSLFLRTCERNCVDLQIWSVLQLEISIST